MRDDRFGTCHPSSLIPHPFVKGQADFSAVFLGAGAGRALAVFSSPLRALSTSAVKPAASRTARSARTLRSIGFPVAFRPAMSWEYEMPFRRAAEIGRAHV